MTTRDRMLRLFSAFAALLLVAIPAVHAQQISTLPLPKPTALKLDDPWIYRGTDIPRDKEWLFGELPNGLRYAVRRNGVPPGQVSIRIRIDAGALHEEANELGFAHLIEHLSFRESKYLANAQAIPTWQRLGAGFGSDTNAQTTATETSYRIDLPDANRAKLEETIKLLSGMIREPALSDANLAAEVPIVLAEARESNGAQRRVVDAERELFFSGQRLSERPTIGTTATLEGATSEAVRAFHSRWYRPENTVIVIAGDGPPEDFAALIERWFADWRVAGTHVQQPDFGVPASPADADPANPVGEVRVLVEPDLPRAVSWAILRPWYQITDNLEYNRGLMIDNVALAIINRRLEARARAGGSFLYAGVQQEDVSRSTDGTFISLAPLGNNWQQALTDVRAVIEDALASPPTEEEIAREIAEIDVNLVNLVDQRINQAGSKLADDIVTAVDIREAVASPETVLDVFRSTIPRVTPEAVLEHSRKLFEGSVRRALYVTPSIGEADAEELRTALLAPVEADGSSRIAATDVSFEKLPPVGQPQVPVAQYPIGVAGMEQVDFANGVKALLWATVNEPGRATVRVRFGSGYRAFGPEDAAYIALGKMALVASGIGDLGAEELDRLATGRKMGFEFEIDDGVFVLEGQTRPEDVADQLYLFAAKLTMPRWDPNPVLRAKALAIQGYESYGSNPAGVLSRDLEWLLSNKDGRFKTPTPEQMNSATPEGFKQVWEPLLSEGQVEVMIFGDIDVDATIDALSNTFGALQRREPIPNAALARTLAFPAEQAQPQILFHHGESDQAAALVSWPLGGGVEGLSEARQLEILGDVFSNRLLDAMREKAGASYSPSVGSQWPVDIDTGGRFLAIAQMPPQMVPDFFAQADAIAADLAANGPTSDEIARVTEPLRQLLNRALSGHLFWMTLLEGATSDKRRIDKLRSLMNDYTETTPDEMKALAQRYLASRQGWRLAVLPEGEQLGLQAVGYPVGR